MLPQDSLRVFVSAVENRSFTTAARELGLTPSAISKHVDTLEKRLGTRLLSRTTRSISPTEAGAIYYERCKLVLEQLQETEEMLKDLDASPKGSLRIWVPAVFGRALLARVATEFQLSFPAIRLSLILGETPPDLVSAGIDVALLVGDLPDSRWVARTLGPLTLALCASPVYLARAGTPHSMDDLQHHALLRVTASPAVDVCQVKPIAHILKLNPRGCTFECNDLDLAYHAAHAGLGIAALPYYLIKRSVDEGRLVHVLPNFEPPGQQVHLLYPQHRYLPQKTRCFLHFLADYFARVAG